MSGRPEVTVVIPTRDRWELLHTHALRSALEQQEVELEVVVVDDGSEDDTVERLRSMGDPRLHVIRHDSARGPSAARNTGIASAHGRWVAFLDDDDLWSPHKLRAQLDAGSSAEAGWVYAGAVVVDGEGAIVAAPELADAGDVLVSLERGNVIWGGNSNVVVRTELLRDLGGFDERLRYFEDWDLWIRLARASRAAACSEILVATLDHPDRVLRRSRRDVMAQFERMLSKHRSLTRRDRLTVVEWLAEEHMRRKRRFRAAGLYFGAGLRFASVGNLTSGLGALFGEPGLRLAGRTHLALRGRTHLPVPAGRPFRAPDVPWLSTRETTHA